MVDAFSVSYPLLCLKATVCVHSDTCERVRENVCFNSSVVSYRLERESDEGK